MADSTTIASAPAWSGQRGWTALPLLEAAPVKHVIVVVCLVASYALYGAFLLSYDCWLGWDDCSHLANSLQIAREIRSSDLPLPVAFVERISHDGPRPPLLNSIVISLLLLLPDVHVVTIVFIATFGMLVLQALIVFWVARWVTDSWTGYLAVVCLLGSAVNVSVGLLLIVETTLSIIWILSLLPFIRQLRLPSWGNELVIGVLLGISMLDKTSSVGLLGIPWLIVLMAMYFHHGMQTVLRYGTLTLTTAFAVCAWWYLGNIKQIAHYLGEALGTDGYFGWGENPYTNSVRILVFFLLTWGPAASLAWLYLLPAFRRDPQGRDRYGEDFQRLARLTLASAGALVVLSLFFHHFEPRYFHSPVPGMVIVAGAILRQIFASGRWFVRYPIALIVAVSALIVVDNVVTAPKSLTDWKITPFLEKLHRLDGADGGVMIGLVGNSGDLNSEKLRVLSELGENAEKRFFRPLTDPRPRPNWKNEALSCEWIIFTPNLKPIYHDGYPLEKVNLQYQDYVNYLNSPDCEFERVKNPDFHIPVYLHLYARKSPQ